MSKKQTDTDKWTDPWFYDLSLNSKLLWLYILDGCNSGGIWTINLKFIEKNYGFKPVLKDLAEKIVLIPGGKLVVKNYCRFQHGSLDSGSGYAKGAVKCLVKEGLDVHIKDGLLVLPVVQREGVYALSEESQCTSGGVSVQSIIEKNRIEIDRIEKKDLLKKNGRKKYPTKDDYWIETSVPKWLAEVDLMAAFGWGIFARSHRFPKDKMPAGGLNGAYNRLEGFNKPTTMFYLLIWICKRYKAPTIVKYDENALRDIKSGPVFECPKYAGWLQYVLDNISEIDSNQGSFKGQKPKVVISTEYDSTGWPKNPHIGDPDETLPFNAD